MLINLQTAPGRERNTFSFHHRRTLRGAPHTPNYTGPHAQHAFPVPCSINPDRDGNGGGEEAGAGLKRQVTGSRSEPRGRPLGGKAPPSGVGRPGSSGGQCPRLLLSHGRLAVPASHRLSHDSPGSSVLRPVTPSLGLAGKEEGNMLLLLTIVLTLPF